MASPPSTTPGYHGTVDSSTSHSQPPSSTAVEMSDLDTSQRTGAGSQGGLLNDISIPATSPISSTMPGTIGTASAITTENEEPKSTTTPAASSVDPSQNTSSGTEAVKTTTSADAPPTISGLDSAAIGPAVENVPSAGPNDSAQVLIITLLLTSGARHPYKIDEKYLSKRNVTVPGVTDGGRKDPYSISVYTLKELILREWREEWEAKPTSPSSIRLIYFGRLLDDKTPLKECKFNTEAANVVHMTVRPQDIVDEEDASKGKAVGRDREGGESTAGCRCVIL
ncbi:ubiquitin-like protein [Coleophoma crateriformis]|uniref:Ubiquitin-like protein n=1 Tax=Coleophoma crateriformis TaxID=565419 RepID=A0A3D8S3B0_9HELO|nr:ubiquitin-like protein [Coleophoma crateriformis]